MTNKDNILVEFVDLLKVELVAVEDLISPQVVMVECHHTTEDQDMVDEVPWKTNRVAPVQEDFVSKITLVVTVSFLTQRYTL